MKKKTDINFIKTVQIECCQDCYLHEWCSKHDENKYIEYFETFRKKIEEHFQDITVIKNQVPLNFKKLIPKQQMDTKYLNKQTNEFVQYPRLGAFQITVNNILVFSKLNSGLWPSHNRIIQILKMLFQQQRNEGDIKKFDVNYRIKNENNSLLKKTYAKVIERQQTHRRAPIQTQSSQKTLIRKKLTPAKQKKLQKILTVSNSEFFHQVQSKNNNIRDQNQNEKTQNKERNTKIKVAVTDSKHFHKRLSSRRIRTDISQEKDFKKIIKLQPLTNNQHKKKFSETDRREIKNSKLIQALNTKGKQTETQSVTQDEIEIQKNQMLIKTRYNAGVIKDRNEMTEHRNRIDKQQTQTIQTPLILHLVTHNIGIQAQQINDLVMQTVQMNTIQSQTADKIMQDRSLQTSFIVQPKNEIIIQKPLELIKQTILKSNQTAVQTNPQINQIAIQKNVQQSTAIQTQPETSIQNIKSIIIQNQRLKLQSKSKPKLIHDQAIITQIIRSVAPKIENKRTPSLISIQKISQVILITKDKKPNIQIQSTKEQIYSNALKTQTAFRSSLRAMQRQNQKNTQKRILQQVSQMKYDSISREQYPKFQLKSPDLLHPIQETDKAKIVQKLAHEPILLKSTNIPSINTNSIRIIDETGSSLKKSSSIVIVKDKSTPQLVENSPIINVSQNKTSEAKIENQLTNESVSKKLQVQKQPLIQSKQMISSQSQQIVFKDQQSKLQLIKQVSQISLTKQENTVKQSSPTLKNTVKRQQIQTTEVTEKPIENTRKQIVSKILAPGQGQDTQQWKEYYKELAFVMEKEQQESKITKSRSSRKKIF